ncbi:hypothetical protein GCM10011494_03770 [Novosphingobium endophyticum]|uniref:Uncharacterized protein n=1 Tax=Novosphingobium endophyticum TaxID=1955250 RepID=A0A916TPU7_9SPHN|nr:hypothetical protein GCM10011494_03770 [Novosphingobium endophyticum]
MRWQCSPRTGRTPHRGYTGISGVIDIWIILEKRISETKSRNANDKWRPYADRHLRAFMQLQRPGQTTGAGAGWLNPEAASG